MKKLISLMCVIVFMLSFSCGVFAAEQETGTSVVVEEFSFEINTMSRASNYEKTMYLYQSGELEDGTMVMSFSETLPASATIYIPVILSASQYQGRSYKVEVDVYTPYYLIKSFYVQVNYGDGDYSYGYATLGTLAGGGVGSFSANYTIYHTYANEGTYTITIPSYTLTIYTDVYLPQSTTQAVITYSPFTVKVS